MTPVLVPEPLLSREILPTLHRKLLWPSGTSALDIRVSRAKTAPPLVGLRTAQGSGVFEGRVFPHSHSSELSLVCALVDIARLPIGPITVFHPDHDQDLASPGRLTFEAHPATPNPSPPPLLGLHIPKTAGNTLLEALGHHFGWDLVHVEEDGRLQDLAPLVHGSLLEHSPAALPLNDEDRKRLATNAKCLFGHGLSHSWFKRKCPGTWITWVRDPAQRLASHYQYLKRQTQANHPLRRLVAEGISFDAFVEREEVRNLQTKYLQGLAKDRMEWIGLSEHFALGLECFRRRFGIQLPQEVEAANTNPNKSEQQSYVIENGLHHRIRELHSKDWELYQFGQEKFRRCCHDVGLEQ